MVHLSPVTSTAKAASSRAQWLTLQMVYWDMGQPGRLLADALGKLGGCQITLSSLAGDFTQLGRPDTYRLMDLN